MSNNSPTVLHNFSPLEFVASLDIAGECLARGFQYITNAEEVDWQHCAEKFICVGGMMRHLHEDASGRLAINRFPILRAEDAPAGLGILETAKTIMERMAFACETYDPAVSEEDLRPKVTETLTYILIALRALRDLAAEHNSLPFDSLSESPEFLDEIAMRDAIDRYCGDCNEESAD